MDFDVFFVEMCLVFSGIRELFYDGFSVFGGGCYVYLQKRKFKVFEVKFEFFIISFWEVGWRFQDCVK